MVFVHGDIAHYPIGIEGNLVAEIAETVVLGFIDKQIGVLDKHHEKYERF